MGKSRTGTGVLLMIGATQVVPLMDGFAKYLSPRYSPWQLTWSRFVVHLAILLPIVIWKFDWRELWPKKPALQIARGAFLTLCTALFFAALARIPLADALALLFCYPFLVALLSPWLLGERFEPRVWAAVLAGLLGIVVILRPGLAAFDWGSLLAIAAGGAYALYFISTRKLAGTAHPLVTLAYTAVFGCVALTAAAPAFWVPPRTEDLPWLAGIGLSAALGHYLLILAFERAPASVLAPLGYSEMVMAVLVGYVGFGDLPDRWTWLGIAIVVASGSYVLLREEREEPTSSAPSL